MKYILYDQKYRGCPAGIFKTYKEVGEYLGLTADAVCRALQRDSLMKQRYTVEKI